MIEIILGCMFSGKTTELIRRISVYQSINKSVLCINHSLDTRTENFIMSHSGNKIPAIKTEKLMSLIETPEYKESELIGIDESQFFTDLLEFVKYSEQQNKNIIISGLDGDYKRKPIGQILECIPLCDSVIKLKAMDMILQDGTPAIFTKRIINSEEQILVGASEMYQAVSRKCYFI